MTNIEIPKKNREVQKVQLDLLIKFDEFAKKHDIKYILSGGTLLGCIRHNGFIPWDNDIDISLDRKNYNKLLKLAPKYFKHPYFFQNAFTDRNYFIGYSRLRNSNTTGLVYYNKDLEYNNGIFIDITPFDKKIDSKILKRLIVWLRDFNVKIMEHYYSPIKSFNLIKKICFKIIKIFPYRFYFWCYQMIISSSLLPLKSKTFFQMFCADDYLNHQFKKEDFYNTFNGEFENHLFPIPANYDAYLKRAYGDYMKFPPMEEIKRMLEEDHDFTHYEPNIPYKKYLENILKQ